MSATLHHLRTLFELDDLIIEAEVGLSEHLAEVGGHEAGGQGAAPACGPVRDMEERLALLREQRREVVLARINRQYRSAFPLDDASP